MVIRLRLLWVVSIGTFVHVSIIIRALIRHILPPLLNGLALESFRPHLSSVLNVKVKSDDSD